jgi:hypothetical protein
MSYLGCGVNPKKPGWYTVLVWDFLDLGDLTEEGLRDDRFDSHFTQGLDEDYRFSSFVGKANLKSLQLGLSNDCPAGAIYSFNNLEGLLEFHTAI